MRILGNRDCCRVASSTRLGSATIEYTLVLSLVTMVLFTSAQQLSERMKMGFDALAKELDQAEEMSVAPYFPGKVQDVTGIPVKTN